MMAKFVQLADGTGSAYHGLTPRLCSHLVSYSPRIRLYSTRTLKPLGTLKYHKTGCQAVEFARSIESVGTAGNYYTGEDEDQYEMSEEEKAERVRWLVGGGKDSRVTMWQLTSFEKT